MRSFSRITALRLATILVSALPAVACSDSNDSTGAGAQTGTSDSGANPGQPGDDAGAVTTPPGADGAPATGTDAATPGQPAVYALATLTFTATSSTTYLNLLPSLENQATVTLDKGREFAGYAAADTSGGKLFVSDGETPKITRFALSDTNDYTEEASIGFGNYGTTPLTGSIFVSGAKAYAPFDSNNEVVWNPADMSIGGPMAAVTTIPAKRDAFNVTRGYGHEVSGTLAYQPYYWNDTGFAHYSGTSQIAVLDTTTDTLAAAVDVPCPHMHIVTKDEDGNVYFSNGQSSVVPAVLDATQPKNCMTRIKAGQKALDSAFTVHFADLAGGREGNNFFYVGNGIGFFNVYHAERDNVTPATDPQVVSSSSNYHLWTIDLKTMKAQIMPGIDYAGGQYTAFHIDGRTFVALPKGDYSATTIYEILSSGSAEKRFDTVGWTFNMFRVR